MFLQDIEQCCMPFGYDLFIYYLIWLHVLDLPFKDSSGITEEWRVQVIISCIYFHSFIFQIAHIFCFHPEIILY